MVGTSVERPEYYEQRAGEAREFADSAGSHEARLRWLDIADHWESMARTARYIRENLEHLQDARAKVQNPPPPQRTKGHL